MAKKKATQSLTAETGMAKTKCPISRVEFKEHAVPRTLSVKDDLHEISLTASPREFASGSLGWYAGEKVMVNVNGKEVKCQVTCSIVIVGSKEAK